MPMPTVTLVLLLLLLADLRTNSYELAEVLVVFLEFKDHSGNC
jgi:hypothetical protein